MMSDGASGHEQREAKREWQIPALYRPRQIIVGLSRNWLGFQADRQRRTWSLLVIVQIRRSAANPVA